MKHILWYLFGVISVIVGTFLMLAFFTGVAEAVHFIRYCYGFESAMTFPLNPHYETYRIFMCVGTVMAFIYGGMLGVLEGIQYSRSNQ